MSSVHYAKLKPFTSDMCIQESIRPVTESNALSALTNDRKINEYGPMGNAAFMTSSNKLICQELTDKIRSYIKLSVPVINTIITGADNNIARRILNLTQGEYNDILNGQLIYDTYEDTYISVREAKENESYLFCGEIIEHIINNYDIEKNIMIEIENIINNKFYTDKEIKGRPIRVVREPEQGNILPGYQMQINFPSQKCSGLDEMIWWFKNVYLVDKAVSKLTALLRLTPDSLDSIYTHTIRVVPRGLRPMVDGRIDGMTVLYSNVIRADSALRKISRINQPIVFALRYRDLQISVDELISFTKVQRENKNRQKEKESQRKSLFEYATSKKGFIRGRMLKKIQNGSMRSVIIADPTLSVDEAGIPEEMLKVAMEYHTGVKSPEGADLIEVCQQVPVELNRAPTLHRLSFLGYKIKVVKGNAIRLHTLSTSGFNADHDGDTMAGHIPYSDEAIEEVSELLGVLKNLYVPASGKVTLMPKQELVYGLNIISSSYRNPSDMPITKLSDHIKLMHVFEMHELSVYDRVLYQESVKTLGEHLIDYIFPEDIAPICKDIEKGLISEIMELLCAKREEVIKLRVDRLVKCAYIAATLYPPCVSILNDYSSKKSIHNPFEGFEQEMSIYRENYHSGYDNQETYNSIYTNRFDEIANYVKDHVAEDMGLENGFVQLVTCGARGDKGNLQQMVSYKGRIAKSATEAFNIVITSSYLSALNGIEQFIAAYGARKSLIDKVRKPAETGEASRNLIHTAVNATIVSEDCHTDAGIIISAEKLM